jgi:hypothetical protein
LSLCETFRSPSSLLDEGRQDGPPDAAQNCGHLPPKGEDEPVLTSPIEGTGIGIAI